MITIESPILLAILMIASFPYAYLLTMICTKAYFEQKLEYQRNFFKKFNLPTHNAGHH